MSFSTGVRYALLAYGSWGLFPIFWKLLKDIPSLEILCHRVAWSFLFYSLLRAWKEKSLWPSRELSKVQTLYLFLASALLTGNWLLYIYAVNSGHVVESSLGYFINPLVNIVLGVFFLNETLSRNHKVAIALVSVGVLLITLEAHRLPWIALALAISFSLYGYTRKLLPIASLAGGQLETLFIVPFVLMYFAFKPAALTQYSTQQWLLLIASGVVTGLPLLWFSEAVKRLPYYLMGFFQFIAPTLMFLCGIVLYREPMSGLKLAGFAFIWTGILYLLFKSVKRKPAEPA